MSTPLVSFVIPTVGHSPVLPEVLAAIRRDAGPQAEIVLVRQSTTTGEVSSQSCDEADLVLDLEQNLGFAGGTNAGIAAARGRFIATVNDDAIIEPGWTTSLLEALDTHPKAGSVQGVNLQSDDPSRIDGAGIAWNSWWQACQIGHDLPLDQLPDASRCHEVFGVSATAAIYRRSALDHVTRKRLRPFDEALESYYEDVDLACRLRTAGFDALCQPVARARHVGSISGEVLGTRRQFLIGNRYLVLARQLGRGFFVRFPVMISRDLIDMVRRPAAAPSLIRGWLRALRLFASYSHFGAPRTLR
jgi:GT2 family glycosyltransferase